jgi:glycosyltransferase involved in cell wall biosynthesis
MNTRIETAADKTGLDISVVIPSYNHARFIIQAIESVLNQSHKNWELILVDDGSTDSTREILDQRYRDHKQIQLVYQTNHGAHHALNQGIALAKGRYVSILNSDDVYHPDRLKTLLTYCDASISGLAFTPVTPVNAEGAEILALDHPWCQLYAQLMRIYRQSGASEALLTGNFAVTSSNFFISTDLIQKLGGFRKKRYNHDWDLMARVLHQGHAIECVGQQSLLSYRIHDGNTITQNTLKARLELKQILQSFVPKNEPFLAKLLRQMQINMRSIRHEHQARVVQKLREGYDLHIHKMLQDLQAQHEQAFSQEQQRYQKAISDFQAQHEQAFSKEQALYQKAITDFQAQHEQAFSQQLARYQKAQADEQALHQANLAALQSQYQAQIDTLNQTQNTLLLQISAQEHHLANILNSRSYQFAQFLSRNFNGVKKLLGLLK